jgi:homoserine O-succinyltransferase
LRFKPRLEAASPLYDAPLRAARAATPRPQRKPTEIAFVNNMPDLAASATQAQFLRLVRSASGDAPFNFRCYLSPLVARSEGMKRQLHQTHEDLDVLYLRGADALIVTGAEPRATLLTDEPFWPDLARLVDWARDHTVASLWSCLAAHAAVQRLDGIMRRRAAEKFSGGYAFERNPEDCLMRGAGPRILTPHSRYNGLDRIELERRGYHISSWSEAVGVDTFWRREPSLFVFAQGHLEYDSDTLLREYRRDALRFLAGERSTYPHVPENYFTARTRARLEEIKTHALTRGRDGCEDALDEILSNEELEVGWAVDATRLYRNWLALVAQEKNRTATQYAVK